MRPSIDIFPRGLIVSVAIFLSLTFVPLIESAPIDGSSITPQTRDLTIDDYKQSVPKVVASVQPAPGQQHMLTLGSASLVGDKIAVTDFHVVDGYSMLFLAFKNGATVPVKVVTGNKTSDYAILRSDTVLPAAPFQIAEM